MDPVRRTAVLLAWNDTLGDFGHCCCWYYWRYWDFAEASRASILGRFCGLLPPQLTMLKVWPQFQKIKVLHSYKLETWDDFEKLFQKGIKSAHTKGGGDIKIFWLTTKIGILKKIKSKKKSLITSDFPYSFVHIKVKKVGCLLEYVNNYTSILYSIPHRIWKSIFTQQ